MDFQDRALRQHAIALDTLNANAALVSFPGAFGGGFRFSWLEAPSERAVPAEIHAFPFDPLRLLCLNRPDAIAPFERRLPGSIIAASLSGDAGGSAEAGGAALALARQAALDALSPRARQAAHAGEVYFDAGAFWIELPSSPSAHAIHPTRRPAVRDMGGCFYARQDQEAAWPREELLGAAEALGKLCLALAAWQRWDWRADFFIGDLGRRLEALACAADLSTAAPAGRARKRAPSSL